MLIAIIESGVILNSVEITPEEFENMSPNGAYLLLKDMLV